MAMASTMCGASLTPVTVKLISPVSPPLPSEAKYVYVSVAVTPSARASAAARSAT